MKDKKREFERPDCSYCSGTGSVSKVVTANGQTVRANVSCYVCNGTGKNFDTLEIDRCKE